MNNMLTLSVFNNTFYFEVYKFKNKKVDLRSDIKNVL